MSIVAHRPAAIGGHSLGGHVVTWFAGLFPEMVKALLVVEGLGPPKRPHQGDDAMEVHTSNYTGHFAEGEMEQRAANFTNHQHHWFEHSGHMVHYDEPERLSALTRNFLEQNYV